MVVVTLTASQPIQWGPFLERRVIPLVWLVEVLEMINFVMLVVELLQKEIILPLGKILLYLTKWLLRNGENRQSETCRNWPLPQPPCTDIHSLISIP